MISLCWEKSPKHHGAELSHGKIIVPLLCLGKWSCLEWGHVWPVWPHAEVPIRSSWYLRFLTRKFPCGSDNSSFPWKRNKDQIDSYGLIGLASVVLMSLICICLHFVAPSLCTCWLVSHQLPCKMSHLQSSHHVFSSIFIIRSLCKYSAMQQRLTVFNTVTRIPWTEY